MMCENIAAWVGERIATAEEAAELFRLAIPIADGSEDFFAERTGRGVGCDRPRPPDCRQRFVCDSLSRDLLYYSLLWRRS